MATACFVSCVAGKGCCTNGNETTTSNGAMANQPSIRSLCKNSSAADGVAKSLLLPDESPEQRAEVDSWIDCAASFSAEHVAGVDRHLNGRSFLAGGSFSLADIAVYFASAPVVAAADPSSARKNLDFSRWFNQAQHRVRRMAPSCEVVPALVSLDIFTPVSIPLPVKASPQASGTPAAPPAVPAAPAVAVGGDAKTAGDGEGGAGASGGAGGASSKKKDKKKKDKKGGEEGTAKVVGVGGGDEGGGGGSKPAPAAVEADPSKLDVRVGVIVKAWEHPDSEKLFCEEIDLGEGKTRMIASGLRLFYKLEEMQGRRVIVLANLKARNIGGFKSEGMVLCASSEDHSVVKIIEPPPGAAIGARATVAGTEGEPASPAQMQKKKVLEKIAPKLKTDGDGLAGYEGVGVLNVDGEPCVPTLPGLFVS